MHKDWKEKTNFWFSDYIIIYIENPNKCYHIKIEKDASERVLGQKSILKKVFIQ